MASSTTKEQRTRKDKQTEMRLPDIIPFEHGDMVVNNEGSMYRIVTTFKKVMGGYYVIAEDNDGVQFLIHRKEILKSRWTKTKSLMRDKVTKIG
jgi:hypothetical protein